MKTFVGAMAVLLLIIVGTQLYTHALGETTDTLEGCVDGILSAAYAGDWEACRESFGRFSEAWDGAKKWFAVFIHHDEMDLINNALYEIEMYIKYERAPETAAKANVLKILLEHIPKNEKFSIDNIL